MKQTKKILLMLLCVGALSGLTGCGKKDTAADSGAAKQESDSNMNGATGGTQDADTDTEDAGGALEEGAKDAGDAIRDGADDVGDAVRDGADDLKEDAETDGTDRGTDRDTEQSTDQNTGR